MTSIFHEVRMKGVALPPSTGERTPPRPVAASVASERVTERSVASFVRVDPSRAGPEPS